MNKPKVRIILKKDGQKTYMYPSLRKTQFFIKNKAKSYLKNGFSITFVVFYGTGIGTDGKKTRFINAGTYYSVEDLKWAFQAFVKEYLT